MHDWANVAEIVKAKTLTGGLVVRATSGLPFVLEEGMEVAFVPPQNDAPRTGRVCSIQPDKNGAYRVEFDSVVDRDMAEALSGCVCLIRREFLPELNTETEGTNLIDYTVQDKNLGHVGQVTGYVELSLQARLEVEGQYGTVLIPFVDEFIARVDEETRSIRTMIPEALIDIALKKEAFDPDTKNKEKPGEN